MQQPLIIIYTYKDKQLEKNFPLLNFVGRSSENKPSWGSCGSIINPNIYLDSNGVTIKCPEATIGEKGFVNAKEYTVVDETTLRTMVENNEDVTCVCTSRVTNMSSLFVERNIIQSKYWKLGHF